MKKFFKRAVAALTASAMMLVSGVVSPAGNDKVSAARDSCKFDFGSGGVASGYTGVAAWEGYNSGKGYGFNTPGNMADSKAAGQGALSDAVVFKSTDRSNTFKVDLNSGLYKITVHLGNCTRASVVAEDVLQLINLTGNNATDSFIIPVTDGQLSLMVTEGKANTVFSLSALEIEKLSSDTTLPPTIWLCGDSTVCNYYPKDTAQRVGWGQLLDKYVGKDFMVRNLAASGQYAAGFVSAGQFDPVLKYGKKGDYYVISIGINDTNYSNAQEYYNVVTDMTKKAKQKGMTVVLVKQQGRAGDITRNPLLTGRWFGSELDKIGKEQNVRVCDLFNLAQNYFLSIGPDATTAHYDTNDTLHFNRKGADLLARLVSEDVKFSLYQEPVVTTTVTTTAPPQTAPPVTTTPAPVSPNAGKLYGDVNDDQVIDLLDLTLISQYNLKAITFTDAEFERADVDGNNTINLSDLAAHKHFLMKRSSATTIIGTLISPEPAETLPEAKIYPAMDAEIYQGMTETVNAGFECPAYVNLNNEVDSSIKFDVDIQKAGNYLVSFRIANASQNDRSMRIEVNGDTQNYWVQPFLTTGAWTTWETRGIVLPFVLGKNTIKAISLTSEGAPNIDYIKLEYTDEPIAEIYQPSSQPGDSTNGKTTIYIAGDSTVQSYRASYAPQQGWGYYLGEYFNSDVAVSNHAIAGRSSKSFYDNGRLTTILNEIKQGDYLFVQFGINDAAYNNAERYAPVCGSAVNPTNGSFEFYINKYVEGALEKGATPVLVTTVIGLKAYSNGRFVNSYDNYCKAMKSIAAQYKIPCIDLNSLMVSHYNSIGYDAAKLYHLHGVVAGSTDMTHFSETGAKAVAGLVADAVKKLSLPLSSSGK